MRRLREADFGRLLGIPKGRLPEQCRRLIRRFDFAYRPLSGQERDRVILEVLETLDSHLRDSGPHRLSDWEKGWSENLRAFVKSGYDLDKLMPGYYRKGKKVMRLFDDYVMPNSPKFETNFLEVLRTWIAVRYLRDADDVYEFGCGPAHNLVGFSRLYPEKRYHGLDWAVASQKIINLISERHKIRIDGHRFDLFHPDDRYSLRANSAVITLGAMEQLGANFEDFLQYLLERSPRICVHVEPIYELYKEDELLDYLAARYSEKRGYLRGYLARLRTLEREGRIELLHVKKNLGSIYHDGWTTVVWRMRRG